MRCADDDDVRLEREQLAVVGERTAAGLPRERARGSASSALIPTSSTSSSAAIASRCKRRDDARADHAVAQPHAQLTSACAAIDRSAATQSRVASSPLPSRW